MKKTVAVFLALVMCLTLLPLTALAAEAPAEEAEEAEQVEMVAIVAKVPAGWEDPCLWAWADDGTNAFEAWPGEEMDPMEGEEGIYYCYVPAFVQNVIVNANKGTMQTDAIAVEAGETAWITVEQAITAETSAEALTETEIPEYVKKIKVHAYVPLAWESVNLWAWADPDGTNAFDTWPGLALKEEDRGWFTGKIPAWANRIIVSGNEGEDDEKTEDVTIEPEELWITVYNDLTYDVAYEDPDKAVEDVTVHAQVPEDWADPCCWAWSAPDGTNAFDAWPGEALTAEEDGWYTIQVPGWINSIIINANEGSVQTSDLAVEPGSELWITVTDAENAQVAYEAP